MTGKMRISLVDKGLGEMRGKVDITGSYAFMKEALLTSVEACAKAGGISTLQLLADLYHTEKANELPKV